MVSSVYSVGSSEQSERAREKMYEVLMHKKSKIYIAGHRGLVGSAIVRRLQKDGYTNLVLRTSSELDLRDQAAVADFFATERPDYVFLAAAKVGGIVANSSCPGEFIYDNLMIQTNIIHHARLADVKRLLFLGSTCIYPKLAPQPLKEEYLLTGPLEPTNEPYAVAKIAGITLCRSYNQQYGTRFLAAMPTNLYGPNDNFDLQTSHVLPALIRKFHEARKAWGWGFGTRGWRKSRYLGKRGAETGVSACGRPGRRLPVPDEPSGGNVQRITCSDPSGPQGSQSLAPALINIGTGEDVTIRELARLVKETVGFPGEVVFDTSMPDGTPRKQSDVSRLACAGMETHNPAARRVVKDL